MFQHQGIWFPDGEKHLPEWMDKAGELVEGKGTYQVKKLRAALSYVKEFGAALDVGAHIGLWSRLLNGKFRTLWAFEPVAEFRECFRRNVEYNEDTKLILVPAALGNEEGKVAMKREAESSGNTHVVPGDDVELHRLDRFAGIADLGFIKIDCEGYEENVVRGGEQTIRRWRPVIIVEQKAHVMERNFGHREPRAVRLLESWGYKVREEISGDYILTC